MRGCRNRLLLYEVFPRFTERSGVRFPYIKTDEQNEKEKGNGEANECSNDEEDCSKYIDLNEKVLQREQ